MLLRELHLIKIQPCLKYLGFFSSVSWKIVFVANSFSEKEEKKSLFIMKLEALKQLKILTPNNLHNFGN